MQIIHSIRHFFERHGFDVSSRFADRLGMRATNVRLFFIYISFVTVGLSFGIYLPMAIFSEIILSTYPYKSTLIKIRKMVNIFASILNS